MTESISGRVLVLNKNWIPIDVRDVFEAVHMVAKDEPRARIVDPETYATYDFESWVETWEDAVRTAKISEDKTFVGSCFAFRIPEVIVLNHYGGFGEGEQQSMNKVPKFTRRNIYIRDKNVCQYCGKKFSIDDLNLDHVIPRSRGGQMTWRNIVLSCISCNDKKRDRTPAEAGMGLIRRPGVPDPSTLKRPWGYRLRKKLGRAVPRTWEQFLGKMYWDVGLKED